MNEFESNRNSIEKQAKSYEKRIVETIVAGDVGSIILVLKEVDTLLTGKAECEFANTANLRQLEDGLRDLINRGKPYVFYLSDAGTSRLVLDRVSISPSPNCTKAVVDKWETIK